MQSQILEQVRSGSFLNLLICVLVVVVGVYWLWSLNGKWREEYRFLYRGYVYWWASWVVWVASWTFITFDIPKNEALHNILTLCTSDLNGVLIILVYFSLTRANEFRLSDALWRGGLIVLALIASYVALHQLFEREFALQLQERWSLCIGVVSQILLGWAISLRFNEKRALIFGYVYGFAQPAVYEAALHAKEEIVRLGKLTGQPAVSVDTLKQIEASQKLITSFVVVLIVLAFLKLSLASIVTRYFIQTPGSTDNLVKESAPVSKGRLSSDLRHVQYFQIGVLLVFFAGAFLYLKPVSLLSAVEAIGAVALLVLCMAGVASIPWVWRRFLRPFFNWLFGEDESIDATPTREPPDAGDAARVDAGESYDVFLSYSSEHEEEAKLTVEEIGLAGGKVFFAPANLRLRGGEDYARRIKGAISSCDEFWLLCTPDSFVSEWVRRERYAAWGLGKTIVPILLNCRPEQLPEDLRVLQHVKFADRLDFIKGRFKRGETTPGGIVSKPRESPKQ